MTAQGLTLPERALARTTPLSLWRSPTDIDTWPAPTLIERSARYANLLSQHGIGRGDAVAVLATTSLDVAALLVAIWICRAVVSILPIDAFKLSEDAAAHKVGAMIEILRPKALVYDRSKEPFASFAAKTMVSIIDLADLRQSTTPDAQPTYLPTLDDAAVVQWTSGSTGVPKAICLSHRQFAENCAAIAERAAIVCDDHMVSWLPLNHDMGLSAITVPLWTDASVTLIPTECFVRSPMSWLEAISHQRGTISPSPAFAYALLARRGKLLQRSKLDLSSWRYAWIGAEPVFPDVLIGFAEATRCINFSTSALKPSYGLAEAVVAVSSPYAGDSFREIRISRNRLRQDGVAELCSGDDSVALASNGPVLSGISVRIGPRVDEWLQDGVVGRVWISGESITKGYLKGEEADRFSGKGWFNTGDLGFIESGEIFITGREKDLIIRGGVNISPQDIETVVEDLLGLRAGQVAAFSHLSIERGREEVCVVVGREIAAPERDELAAEISKAVIQGAAVQVDHLIFIAARLIPKTTSGKVQRNAVRQLYLSGAFTTAVQG